MSNLVHKQTFIFTLVVLASVLTGCSGTSNKTETDRGTEKISYKDITSDFPNLRYQKAGNFVFRSRAKMSPHIESHSLELSSGKSLPEVDFDKSMVVIIAVGVRSNAGYRLVPVSVRASADKTVIEAKEITPPADSLTADVLTYPFLALVVPKRDGQVKVKFTNRD